MRVTYHFDEISRSRLVRAKCKKCGKRFQRTFTESQTVNPYNRNTEGYVKSQIEIAKECADKVSIGADEFSKYPLCSNCRES
jgi:hypothetical protein